MKYSIIVPAAANKPEYKDVIPNVFRLNEKGVSRCIETVLKLDLSNVNAIYFTILKEHNDKYGIADLLQLQIDRLVLPNVKIVVLDEPTSSQAETIYRTIVKEYIVGPIFVKDADCSFVTEINVENGVVVYPIEKLSSVNPQHKSYVAVDDQLYITNIIEKKVIDHYFNAGGYMFEDAILFEQYYEQLEAHKGLYLSHIIYSMLLDGFVFRPFIADTYDDFEQTSKN